jgi:hypothetical protein
MELTQPRRRPCWAAIVLVALTCGLMTLPAAPAAARRHARVASLRVKLPAAGDLTIARVVLRVKLVPGSTAHNAS